MAEDDAGKAGDSRVRAASEREAGRLRREARLAEALRANLRRRKAQSHGSGDERTRSRPPAGDTLED
ncbi:hypothetical protein [Pseudoxanthobacter sp.]|uniref:hypothetical protein n=1 Tax=Pseudoxanthobacter sp. TaxID=1925742 RepID=UPI002FE23C55